MADDVVRDIPEEMVEKAVRATAQYNAFVWEDEAGARRIFREGLSAALAGRTVLELPEQLRGAKRLEFCRACRDERDEIVAAEFILWGKLFPPEQFGPRCYDHTAGYIGWQAMSQIDQWAIFDLRPLSRLLAAGSGVGDQHG